MDRMIDYSTKKQILQKQNHLLVINLPISAHNWKNICNQEPTVGENIITAIKKRNNYGAFIFPILR